MHLEIMQGRENLNDPVQTRAQQCVMEVSVTGSPSEHYFMAGSWVITPTQSWTRSWAWPWSQQGHPSGEKERGSAAQRFNEAQLLEMKTECLCA